MPKIMDKPAKTEYTVHQLIANRWSPVAFDPTKIVEPEKIGSLLEAARWAASCFNEQPWAFILATKDNPVGYKKMFSCLAEGNRTWVENAPLIAIAVAKLFFEHNQKPNRHAFHDLGLAIGNLTLQAEAMGLKVHQMAGFDPDLARRLYQIPEGFEAVTAIAIGYQGDVTQLPPDLQQREKSPRSRKALRDFVFENSWHKSYFS